MKTALSLLVLALAGAPLSAHECWLQPATFTPVAGPTIGLTIQVGEHFQGEPKPFNPERIAALRHFSKAGSEDWAAKANNLLQLPVRFEEAGTHVVIYDSKPSLITLKPEEFDAYLREEGLEFVIAERARAGESAEPGRERYRRCNKVIVAADGKADDTWSIVTGQQLEMLPLENPAVWKPGTPFGVKILLAGRPLVGARVAAWNRATGELVKLDAITTDAGAASFTLPAGGQWMFSTVHMARLNGDKDADWESHWGNLTLAVRRR
jgi:uncharacterized GH25 family protein